MNAKEFGSLIEKRISLIRCTLMSKGDEYSNE